MRRITRSTATAVLLFLSATLGAHGCGSASASTCKDGARTYQDGDQWTCSDGCNICACHDGTRSTTAMGCPSPPGPAAGKLMCWEGRFMHKHGETWVCADGCDECTCSDGRLSSTPRVCIDDGGADAQ